MSENTAEQSGLRWPGQTTEAFPEVFNTIPPQPKEKKPGQLTQEQLTQFFQDGYLIVEDYLPRELLDACREAINVLVEELAQKLHKAGKIKKLYKDYGLFQRLSMIENEFPGANIILHKYGRLPQAFRDLWSYDHLLNIAEQLLGTSDIVGHPVWNLRTKTPKNEATTVPWHQDVGYLDNSSYKVLQPTAWIPLLDTDDVNGCMQVVRGGHRTGKVATHQCCFGNTWYVMLEEDEMERTLGVNMQEDLVTCPIPYGGMLLINNMIPHRSLNNLSQDIRWSLDLRWQRADKPVGFYGLKQGLRMRSSTEEKVNIDWESFDTVDRHTVQVESVNLRAEEFDTTVQGPWMRKWEMVHTNRHTAALKDDVSTGWHNMQP